MIDILLIVVVLLLIFGAGKLKGAGSDLGAAVKGIRKELRGAKTPAAAAPKPAAEPDAEFPEVLAARSRGSGKPGA